MLNLPGLIVEGMKETDEEQTFTVSVLPVSTRTAQGHRRGHAAAISRARAPGHRVQVINPGEARREDALKLIYQPHFLLSH